MTLHGTAQSLSQPKSKALQSRRWLRQKMTITIRPSREYKKAIASGDMETPGDMETSGDIASGEAPGDMRIKDPSAYTPTRHPSR